MTTNPISRRDALRASALAGTAAWLAGRVSVAAPATVAPTTARAPMTDPNDVVALAPGVPGCDYVPVVVPNGWTLPFEIVDGVKVFHLVAEPVDHEFTPGLVAQCWGYNGSVHGPVIEAVEGDRVRLFVTNRLDAATTVHWHGVLTPSGMDGVGGLNQPAIRPGETFVYEFTLRQHGTLMYHSHHDEMTQMGMGMVGMFVIHPRQREASPPDRDFVLQMHEWSIPVGANRPNPNEMTDFNVLTFNARAFPGTAPLVVRQGDRVRVRFGNLGAMDHHPIHLHGFAFTVTETDGGPIPESARRLETTVLVPVGSTRTIEFVADNPGDWAMHCHMTHHVMNQMGHNGPNMVGVDAAGLDESARALLPGYMTMGSTGMGEMGEMKMKVPPNSVSMVGGHGPYDYITMGGMFTILKVHPHVPDDPAADVGWYRPKPGELATLATAEALERSGIQGDGTAAPRAPLAKLRQVAIAEPPRGNPTSAPSTSAITFACSMHPEVVSDRPGACPKCGMKLVVRRVERPSATD